MAKIDDILRAAVSRKASDIHFSAESAVMIRQHGDLVALDSKVYSNAELQEILLEIIEEKDKKRFHEHKNLDKSYSVPNCGNFRLNYFWSRRGVGAVIRWLPTRMPEIDDLGLPSVVKKLADLPKGLLLVTGPTGSGKSTTLAAIINYMNTNFSYHILTVEDPVEFVHPCKKSLINQREIGQSCLTFADALKYALREDPDVILVGEMRDQETIGLALTAAETGHLVLGTLHTRGAASSIDRIIESFPATERPLVRAMLSESLRAVISQILLKAPEGSGRVAAYEIMVSNYAISNLIREGKTFQIPSILQTAKGEGMMQMEAHIRQLMAEGKVDPADADAALTSMMRANAGGNQPATGGGGAGAPTGAGAPGVKFTGGGTDVPAGAQKGPRPQAKPGAPAATGVKPPESAAKPVVAPKATAPKAATAASAPTTAPKSMPGPLPANDKTVAGITIKDLQKKEAEAKAAEMKALADKALAEKVAAERAAIEKAALEKAAALKDSSLRSLNEETLAPKMPVTAPIAPAMPITPKIPAVPTASAPSAPKPITLEQTVTKIEAPAMPIAPKMPSIDANMPLNSPAATASSEGSFSASLKIPPPAIKKEKPSPVDVPTKAEEITKAPSEGSSKKPPPRPVPTKKAG